MHNFSAPNNSFTIQCGSGHIYTATSDNIVYNVSEEDSKDLINAGCVKLSYQAYGMIFFDSATPVSLTIPTANVLVHVVSTGSGIIQSESDGSIVSTDLSIGHAEINIGEGGKGLYLITYGASYYTGANNQTTTAYVCINGACSEELTSSTKAQQSSTILNSSRSAILPLEEGDIIGMGVTCNISGGIIYTNKFNIFAARISK